MQVRALNVLQAGGDTTSPAPVGTGNGDNILATWLQVGAFGEQRSALALHLKLRREGFDPVTLVTTKVNDKTLHRVRIGPFQSETELRAQADRLVNLGLEAPVRVSIE
ncbi:MAG: SPOR domain-containing protein [Xanthomonadales bacterium]|nr:SPOR domain-containing protein [Xanthomonadales bacterium]